MAWVFFVVGALVVVAIAFYAVGKVTGEMASQRPPAVYELPVAVEWIANRLPDEVTARISYEDVTRILTWHLDWFTAVGVSSEHGQELGGTNILHEGSVAIEDAAVDAVVAESIEAGGEIDAVDVVCVLDLQMAYLHEIGAVGAAAERNEREQNQAQTPEGVVD
ncbi:MAG: hypothetical protein AAGC53_08170 [Actinomycetota bacterium]